MLLVGALASLGLSYTTEAWAASPSQSVNAVQQAKKVTGNVSDAEVKGTERSVYKTLCPKIG